MSAPPINGFKLLSDEGYQSVWKTQYHVYISEAPFVDVLPQIPVGWEAYSYARTLTDVPAKGLLTIRPLRNAPSLPPASELPKLEYKTIAQAATAGTGIEKRGGNVKLENLHVEGYSHNIDVQGSTTLILKNVRSIRSYRDKPEDRYGGQGIYFEDVDSTRMEEVFFGYNGYSRDNPRPGDFTMFRQGVYIDAKNNKVAIFDPLAPYNAACGIQNRANECEIRGGLLIGNANNIMNAVGRMKLYDTTIYDANYYWDGSGWVGQVGVYAYWPIEMRNVWIIGRQGQADRLPAPGQGGAKKYIPGGVICDPKWEHPDAKPSPVPLSKMIDAQDCLISGWPDASGQNSPFRNFDGKGFVVRNKALTYSPTLALEACLKNEISIKETIRRISDAIRSQIP